MNIGEPIVFVVPGDLHLTMPNRNNHRTAVWMSDEVNRLIRPDLVRSSATLLELRAFVDFAFCD